MSLLNYLRLGQEGADPRTEVMRDLQSLLNATTSLGPFLKADPAARNTVLQDETIVVPEAVANSVLNYGMPPLAGSVSQYTNRAYLQEQIRMAIERFEPRLYAVSVQAAERASDREAGVLSFEINALMRTRAGEAPWSVMSRIDLDSGDVVLEEV